MEDVEYLEEYEDLILPKTMNYSEEFPVNSIEENCLNNVQNNSHMKFPSVCGTGCEESYLNSAALTNPSTNTTNSNLPKIIDNKVLSTTARLKCFIKDNTPQNSAQQETQQIKYQYERSNTFMDRISHNPVLQKLDKYKSIATVKPTIQKKLTPTSHSFFSTVSKLESPSKMLDVNVSNRVTEDDNFLDYAIEKHGVENFTIEFDLDNAEISDICSDSINYGYDEEIFGLESLLSNNETTKKNLKRKNVPEPNLETVHKKTKYGKIINSQKSDQNESVEIARKHSTNQKHLKNSPSIEKKKNQISFEKRKCTSNGKQSKLVVKKNGKKFVFPDRSKFSLKKITSVKNVEDKTKRTLTSNIIEEIPQGKLIPNTEDLRKEVVSYSCSIKKNAVIKPTEGQTNTNEINLPINLGHVKENDRVVFSSPKNMKRIYSETIFHQNIKKSTKPNGQLLIKPIPSPSKHKTKEYIGDKPSKESIELEKIPGKDTIGLSKKQVTSVNAFCLPSNEENESKKLNDSFSPSYNEGKKLKSVIKLGNRFFGEKDITLEKASMKANGKKENFVDQDIHLCLKELSSEDLANEQFLLNVKINDTDNISKNFSNENKSASKIVSVKEKLETRSKDLDYFNNKEKTTKVMSEKIIEDCNFNTVKKIYDSNESNLDNFSKDESNLETNNSNETSENDGCKDLAANTIRNSVEKTVKKRYKKHENKYVNSEAGQKPMCENFAKDEHVLRKIILNPAPNKETVNKLKSTLEKTFQPRDFSIRLNKSIVAKLLKIKTNSKPSNQLKYLVKQNSTVSQNNSLKSPSKKTLEISEKLNESTAIKVKAKRGRKRKNIQPADTEKTSIAELCLSNGIVLEKEKQNVPNLARNLGNDRLSMSDIPSLAENDSKQTKITANVKEKHKKSSTLLTNQGAVNVAEHTIPASAKSQSSDSINKQGINLPMKKNNMQVILNSKENNQSESSEITENVKKSQVTLRKEPTVTKSPELQEANCNCFQTQSGKDSCQEVIVELKKENNDEILVPQLRPTNILTNDSLLNNIKFNSSPDTNLNFFTTTTTTNLNNKSTDITMCKKSKSSFEESSVNLKYDIFELPAFIVMKTKIITRKDLETNKTIVPPIIKQQADTETESIIPEPVIKSERPEFSSVCAQINSLLEQNANYLKFASGSERLSRMNDVLRDCSLSVQDANCTLKFLQSYLSSDSREKNIRTKGQPFIPICDSQKRIIGYRKRTVHVKASSSRRSSRRTTKMKAQPFIPVSSINANKNSHRIENGLELPPKIEPDLSDIGDSELIVPDTSPANDICIKSEDLSEL